MRRFVFLAILMAISLPVFAGVKLHNKDSESYDITVKCSSTVIRSISGSTVSDLGNGPCTVTLTKTGTSTTGQDGDTIVIANGGFSK